MLEKINYKKSGGFMDVTMRALQTFRLEAHENGTITVIDEIKEKMGHPNPKSGFGFKTVEDAIRMFERKDHYRSAM